MKDIIDNIEKKLNQFVSKHHDLQKKETNLIEENNKLFVELKKKEEEIVNLKEKLKIINISKSVDASQEDIRLTKLKINGYLREIDKCIALLNK